MSVLAVALALALGVAGPGQEDDAEHAQRERARSPAERERDGLERWLTRPVPPSARFLDHGVIAVTTAGGTPHLYRLDLRVGLLDVLSLGVTAHWLPGQRAPQVWPVAALALYRGGLFEVGGHYRPVLHPPVDPQQRFVPQTHMGLGSFVLGAGWFSAGLDVGAAHTRVPLVDPNQPLVYQRRTVFAGGVFARVGNRHFGVTADALAVLSPDPLLVFEVAVDLRFAAFERRPRTPWGRRP